MTTGGVTETEVTTAITAKVGGITVTKITMGEVDITGVGTKMTGGTPRLTDPKSALGEVDVTELWRTTVGEIERITALKIIIGKADVIEVAIMIIVAGVGRIAANYSPTKGTGGAQRNTTKTPTTGARSAAGEGLTVHAVEDHPAPNFPDFHRPKRRGGWRSCKQMQRVWRMTGARGWLQLINGRRTGARKITGLDLTGLALSHKCMQ